jgi:outer membrane protein, heavy metal efflux system
VRVTRDHCRHPGRRAGRGLALALAWIALALLHPRPARAQRPAEEAGTEPAHVGQLLRDRAALIVWLAHTSAEVAASAARIDQAHADVSAARLWPNPTFDVTLADVNVGQSNPPGLKFGDTYQLGFGLAETVELGKRGPRRSAAGLRLESARHGFRDVLAQRTADARLALGRVVHLRARLRLLEESYQSATHALELEKVRLQQGYLSGTDYERLALDTLGLETELGRSRAEHETALAACKAVLVAPCDDTDAQVSDLDAAAALPSALDAGVLERRPDIEALRHDRFAALATATLARRRALPDPTLRAGFFYDRLMVSGDQPKTVLFTVTIPLPVFDHGQADAARADSRAAELASTVRGALERARADLQGLLARRAAVERTLHTLETEGVPRSRAVLETTVAAFDRGQVSLTDLLLARRTHLGLSLTVLELRFDALAVRSDLCRVLGLDAEAAEAPRPRRM